MPEWISEEFVGVGEHWPDAADVVSRPQVFLDKFSRLEGDETHERNEETKMWSGVKELWSGTPKEMAYTYKCGISLKTGST